MSRTTKRRAIGLTDTGILLVTLFVCVRFYIRSAVRQGRLDHQVVAAVRADNVKAVSALLDAGANANSWDTDAPPRPFTTEMFMWLLHRPVAPRDITAAPILVDAAARPDDGIVGLLLAKGANPNLRDQWGKTALMIAASNSDPVCVQALLAHGAQVNATMEGGDTAWGYAASESRGDDIAVLIRAGAVKPAGLPWSV